MKRFTGFEQGMGIGGWLTNYKRFNVLPQARRLSLTIGDMEHFASYITESDIAYIASLGMDHIRLGFDQVVLEEAPGVYREEIFCHMDHFIGWCKKHGLNVVLNLHKAIGNYCDIKEEVELLDDEGLQARFIALWLAMENRYHGDNTIAFELLNEVRNVDPAKWNALADKTIAAIRRQNKDRIIVLGSICWNHPEALHHVKVYDDENIIYTFHMYKPHEFTHQRGVLQAGPLYYNREMPYPGDIDRYRDYKKVVSNDPNGYPGYEVMDKQYLQDAMQPAFDFIQAHPDKILWCGEFGTIRHANIRWRESWMRDVIALLKEHQIPYCVWNYLSTPNDGNRFSLVDDDTRKILSPALAEIIRGNV